jgi:phage FluMu protein gp41
MDETYDELRKKLFDLKIQAEREKRLSDNKMTVSSETLLEIEKIKKQIAFYLIDRKEGKVK